MSSDTPIPPGVNICNRGRSNTVNYAPTFNVFDRRSINIIGFPQDVRDRSSSEFMASSFVKRPQGQSSGAERPNHQRASTMSEHPRLMGLIYDRILPPPDTYSQYLFGPQPLQHGVSDLGPDGQAWSTDLGEHHANFPRNQGPARDEAYRRRYSTTHNDQPSPQTFSPMPPSRDSCVTSSDPPISESMNSIPGPLPVNHPRLFVQDPSTSYLLSPPETNAQIPQTNVSPGVTVLATDPSIFGQALVVSEESTRPDMLVYPTFLQLHHTPSNLQSSNLHPSTPAAAKKKRRSSV